MQDIRSARDAPRLETQGGGDAMDAGMLLAEVAAIYPLLAHAALADDEVEEATALDAMILAGLVSP